MLQKKSKSDLSDLSRINLTDEKDKMIDKIKRAKTDSLPFPSKLEDLKKRLEVKNLVGIYSSLSEVSTENIVKDFSGKNFSEFKDNLAQVLVDKINPISLEIKKLLNDQEYLDKILVEGCEKAENIASKKIKKIHELLGF